MIEQDYLEQPQPASPLLTLQHWQRVSAIALVYFSLGLFKTVFGNISYLAPMLLVFYQGIQRYPGYFAIALVGVALILTVLGFLYYWTFRFRITADSVEIHSGVLRKKQLNLPFHRIQNVRLLQPLYYRFTDQVCVVLDTAGSNEQEATLAALSRPLAEALQQAIYHAKVAVPAESAAAVTQGGTSPPVAVEGDLLCERSVKDLIYYGISNNRVMLVLGLAAPFYNPITTWVVDALQGFGVDPDQWLTAHAQSWFWLGLAALALTMFIMLVITLASITFSVLSYYQFQLWQYGDRYFRRSGLLTRHEISMQISRLQWFKIQQDWLDKLLGRCNVHYEQVQTALSEYQESAEHGKIMVPALEQEQVWALLNGVYPDNQLQHCSFNSVNWRYLLAPLICFCLPLCLLSQYVFLFTAPHYALLSALGVLGLVLLFVLRWRRFGYAFDASYLYVRQGVIGVDYYCVPIFKLQQLTTHQHGLMIKAGLQHLSLSYAAGSLTIPYMPVEDAQRIANYSLYQAERSHTSWM